jgi:uncharacterized protein (TIGR02996 family)
MTHEDAFLQAIGAAPQDDTPRLVYADWLQEHGGPAEAARGEFIRAQCLLAAGELPPERQERLQGRLRELLERYQAEWLGPLHLPSLRWQFRRGLVEALSHTGLFQQVEDAGPRMYWDYFRFYPDNTVLGVTSTGRPAQVARWLRKGYDGATGPYRLRQAGPICAIDFSTTYRSGTIDYTGSLRGHSNGYAVLLLDVHSHINGYRGRHTYRWVDVPGCDSAAE